MDILSKIDNRSKMEPWGRLGQFFCDFWASWKDVVFDAFFVSIKYQQFHRPRVDSSPQGCLPMELGIVADLLPKSQIMTLDVIIWLATPETAFGRAFGRKWGNRARCGIPKKEKRTGDVPRPFCLLVDAQSPHNVSWMRKTTGARGGLTMVRGT